MGAIMTLSNKELQFVLNKAGYNCGEVDGWIGRRTRAAISALRRDFRRAFGTDTDDLPEWLQHAYEFLGLKEIKGKQHNKVIVGWWERLKLPFRDDETPWCAGFMNRMVQKAGLPIPKKNRAAALGWRWNGHGTQLDGPVLGAVFSCIRPGKRGSGHTGFVAGRDKRGRVMILGGNQGDMVSINPYSPTDRKAQYHWPSGSTPPRKTGLHTLPVINSGGRKLQNEA